MLILYPVHNIEGIAMKQLTPAQYTKTIILLGLWDLHGLNVPIARSKVLNLVKRKGDTISNYTNVITDLLQDKLIEASGSPYQPKWLLTQDGLEALRTGLLDREFGFEGINLRVKTANALLKWIRATDDPSTIQSIQPSTILSYELFKTKALEIFDRLNSDFNLDNFIPIYRIRREIGNQVERSNFSSWLLKMQSEDILQLLEGSIEDSSSDKVEDSVRTPLGKLRCYAKRIA